MWWLRQGVCRETAQGAWNGRDGLDWAGEAEDGRSTVAGVERNEAVVTNQSFVAVEARVERTNSGVPARAVVVASSHAASRPLIPAELLYSTCPLDFHR